MATPQPPPYAGLQPGPMRTLTLDLRKTPLMLSKPWVKVDGRPAKMRWGTVQVPVLADRPCLVEAYMPFFGGSSGTASGYFWLYPHHPPHLEYSAPYNAWFSGHLGPPGTTQHTGKGPAILLGVVAGCVLAGLVALGVLGAVLG